MTKRSKTGPREVREPIQVYLTADERSLLDEAARETGYSRAEILRRGLRSFLAHESSKGGPMLSFLDRLDAKAFPEGVAEHHDEHLVEAYLDRHDPA